MKRLFNSFKISFSMYSQIPTPQSEWTSENMRYVMCFFPCVGIIIGVIIWPLSQLAIFLNLSQSFEIIFVSIILMIIPVIITGGIHIDGLLDTADALSSYRDLEKRLEILKDPRSGAFAIITCVMYFALYFGINSMLVGIFMENTVITNQLLIILCLTFVVSRSFSGLSVVSFKMAKNTGLAHAFADNAQKNTTKIVMITYILIAFAIMLFVNVVFAISVIVTVLAVFIYYKAMSLKQFGGITGDLCGWFLQYAELIMALSLVITYLFIK